MNEVTEDGTLSRREDVGFRERTCVDWHDVINCRILVWYHVKPQVPILPLPVQWLPGESRVNLQLDTFGAVTGDRLCLPASSFRYQPASFSNLHDASPDSS
jgi:hypothetical protein